MSLKVYVFYLYICTQNFSSHAIYWLGSCIIAGNQNHNSFKKWVFTFSLITQYSKLCSRWYFSYSVKPLKTQAVSNFYYSILSMLDFSLVQLSLWLVIRISSLGESEESVEVPNRNTQSSQNGLDAKGLDIRYKF